MAVKFKFLDVEDSCYLEINELDGNIFVYVNDESNDFNNGVCVIIDIPTAIKLHKTLRTEINKAKEVDNG